MANPEPTKKDAVAGRRGPFEVRFSLTGMDLDNVPSVVLPAKLSGVTSVSDLLAYTFPPGEGEQRAVASMLDVRANPDLPDIYAVFLDAFDEWRRGRCTLLFSSGDGRNLDMSDLVTQQLEYSPHGAVQPPWEPIPLLRFDKQGFARYPRAGLDVRDTGEGISDTSLRIQIKQRYRVIEYASQTDFWEGKEELLSWLHSLTFLYFLDKHEVEIPASNRCGYGQGLIVAAADLESKDLIDRSPDTQTFGITEKGREFVGGLLSETESYIDLYDHFKDIAFDFNGDTLNGDALEPGTVEFDTGRGVDLRVQVFEVEGLDPVRTVFLLRLYDGTLDEFVSTWQVLLDDEAFFDTILEPVANRSEVDEASISQILESGHVYLEEQVELARELESRQEIIWRVWAQPDRRA